MNRQQTSRLFIADTSNGFDCLILAETHKRYGRVIRAALAGQLKSQQDWEILGRTLIAICQYAHAAREIDVLREASQFVVSLPLRTEIRMVGLYYQAQVLHRTGESEAARVVFEELAIHPRFPWRVKAITSIAGCHFTSGHVDTASALYLEALRQTSESGRDLGTWLTSQWMTAVIRSRQGDHNNALGLLESIEPVVSEVGKIHPATCYDYLNSRAVELIGLNRLDEAERLNRITLASPLPKELFPFYETRDEIREKREAAAAIILVNGDALASDERASVERPHKQSPASTAPDGSQLEPLYNGNFARIANPRRSIIASEPRSDSPGSVEERSPVCSERDPTESLITFGSSGQGHAGSVHAHGICVLCPAKTIVPPADGVIGLSRFEEARNGNAARMNTAQTSRLFIADTSNGLDFSVLPETHKRYGRLIVPALRRQLRRQQDWETLGRALITICQYAHAARQVDVLAEASEFAVSLPLRTELRVLGLYYQAQALHRRGESEAARVVFEELAIHPRFPWKPRAIASIAGCYFDSGDLDSASTFYFEALRSARDSRRDLRTWLTSQWMIAVIRSRYGDHNNALGLLESIEPVVSEVGKIHPATCYDYLNSRAVELIGLNHLDEAERLNRITLASPLPKELFPFYETRDEIREKREAAAATVYVNIDPVPRPEPVLTEHIPDACQPATDPEAEASARTHLEVEASLPQSKPDIGTAIGLRDDSQARSAQRDAKQDVQPNLDLKSAIVIILSSPQRKAGALLPSKSRSGLQRPLIPMSIAIPDNHRPRAPPIT